ncbi:hypothetical protein BJY01DRAFT_259677 [Aspergillus pseudoustus]|uniref:Transcription factor domain-containing protein n=1 Tax=Aspergillus pseudoustus TaxID=1810923 RepID=A0ABR4J266_9EURO
MNVLPTNPDPEDGPAKSVDIPFHTQGSYYALVDEKAPQIAEAENQKLDDLMGKFTKGFDPGAFGNIIVASLPKLAIHPFPGTYTHLLLLLLESFEILQTLQLGMEQWLLSCYNGNQFSSPTETNLVDENFFGTELEMLRRLLEPIREGTKKSIFWMNTRRADASWACEQLEASIRVIESFKKDICAAAAQSSSGSKTFYSSLPVSVERDTMLSLRQHRIDACRASLYWDSYGGSDIELTSFFRFYKQHISENEPAKARASGWLPPKSPQTPRLSEQPALEGDLASWVSLGIDNEVLDLMLKTALWLSVARGLAAVHLFCDIARLFVLDKPSPELEDEHLHFLQCLTRHRYATGGAQFSPSLCVPQESRTFPNRNVDYFQDIWKTSYGLADGLYDNNTFLSPHNVANFRLSRAPSRRRSGHGDIQLVVPTPVREPMTSILNTPDESYSEHGASDEYDFISLSPDSDPACSRSKTF